MSPRRRSQSVIMVVGVAIGWLLASLFWPVAHARSATPARTRQWQHSEVSWYGPGFYGHRFACAGHPGLPSTYGQSVRGVAHKTLPCGTRIVLCLLRPSGTRRCVIVQVIDRGPYVAGRDLDATARTARDLCGCWRPYTMSKGAIRWSVYR